MARMIALATCFCGLTDSPAIWVACSKPCRAKTTPAGRAAKTPWKPNGAKPPLAVKLPPWKSSSSSVTMVSTGTKIFHNTMPVLLSDIHLAPPRLMKQNSAMARMPMMMPRPVNVPSVLTSGKVWATEPTELT